MLDKINRNKTEGPMCYTCVRPAAAIVCSFVVFISVSGPTVETVACLQMNSSPVSDGIEHASFISCTIHDANPTRPTSSDCSHLVMTGMAMTMT